MRKCHKWHLQESAVIEECDGIQLNWNADDFAGENKLRNTTQIFAEDEDTLIWSNRYRMLTTETPCKNLSAGCRAYGKQLCVRYSQGKGKTKTRRFPSSGPASVKVQDNKKRATSAWRVLCKNICINIKTIKWTSRGKITIRNIIHVSELITKVKSKTSCIKSLLQSVHYVNVGSHNSRNQRTQVE